eukprot:CAMPEP_0197675726 /NCGR_PEP_ID=MMETSP1338-20131121/85482_1 /TAXON_ID=43686 ORGANISM="Pelagodinium beii, Strain RCC1491" /NCGR_SAMPLE_ID=MMETSP1338 /ASSEMBLY_ACC=CAM_ASM_000754 /LENGTH=246 /DNA_ID=CAMNT_0043256309 /DNA_START=44 /DNA_END=781 /DNA_ORIENTATION=+
MDEDQMDLRVLRVQSSPVEERIPEHQLTHGSLHRLMPADMHGAFRSVSRMLNSRGINREFRCVVCLDNCSIDERFILRDCPAQDRHATCRACATQYYTTQIEEGRVNALRCPSYGSENCTAELTEEALGSLLGKPVLDKYHRFMAMSEDTFLRECPYCHELVCPAFYCKRVVPDMLCGNGHIFCYHHSNAHSTELGACEAYTQKRLRENRKLLARYNMKACPSCGVLTEKTSGCNHMTCASCKADW